MQKERPLSPHLQIYKPQLTSMLSIVHRGSGVFLAIGAPILVLWLWSLATGPEAYAQVQSCLSRWIGQLFLLGWTFSLYFHLCNGVRHLFWDIGRGFEMETLNRSGMFVVFVSLILTAGTCFLAVSQMGGA